MASEWMPWEDTEGNEQRIQRREMRLPPHLQMHGNMRLLRDALLATMLLHERFCPADANPYVTIERNRQRANQKAVMEHKAKMLKVFMEPETIEKCRAAAAEMLGMELKKQRAQQARKFEVKKKLQDKYTEEAARYFMKNTNVREKKLWNI